MGQEFVIKSQNLEDKVNQLLPSQGGFQAGVDLSASTTIIPIVDLTESAEGSNFRADLQTALSHNTATTFNISNTTTTVINTTGYWRIVGTSTIASTSSTNRTSNIGINDGTTTKNVWVHVQPDNPNFSSTTNNIDLTIFLSAGDSLVLSTNTTDALIAGSVRQIADINGTLINP